MQNYKIIDNIKEYIYNKENRKFYKGYRKSFPCADSKSLNEYMIKHSFRNQINDLMYDNPTQSRIQIVNFILKNI